MELFHTILVLLLAFVIGGICFGLLLQIQLPTFNAGARKMSATITRDSPYNRWGKRIFSNVDSGKLSFLRRVETNLRWCEMGKKTITLTLEGLLFQACIYACVLSFVAILLEESWGWIFPIFAFFIPFYQLDSKARAVQRKVLHTLPIFTTIIAAEADTGAAPLNAVIRAANLPIPVGTLIRKELLVLQQHHENIFTYQDKAGLHYGALRMRIQAWGLPDLTELVANIDSISKQGVDRAERLTDLAHTQNLNYQAHVDKAIRKLETSVQLPIGIFFILPLLVSILVPFFLGMAL